LLTSEEGINPGTLAHNWDKVDTIIRTYLHFLSSICGDLFFKWWLCVGANS